LVRTGRNCAVDRRIHFLCMNLSSTTVLEYMLKIYTNGLRYLYVTITVPVRRVRTALIVVVWQKCYSAVRIGRKRWSGVKYFKIHYVDTVLWSRVDVVVVRICTS
jgi:hypothetical protein